MILMIRIRIIIIVIIITMMIIITDLAINSPRLSHHEGDLLLRQHLPQGGHRGRKVFKRMIIIMLIMMVMMIVLMIMPLLSKYPPRRLFWSQGLLIRMINFYDQYVNDVDDDDIVQ